MVCELFQHRMVVMKSTIEWLNESSYIRYSRIDHTDAEVVVLSSRGLEALRVSPDSLGKESLGDQLVKLTKDGLGDSTKAGIKAAITGLITHAWKLVT